MKSRNEILSEIKGIMEDVFDSGPVSITENTVSTDVESWDSLNHIQLVVAMEKHFGIKFSAQEIRGWKNVGEICNSIEAKAK